MDDGEIFLDMIEPRKKKRTCDGDAYLVPIATFVMIERRSAQRTGFAPRPRSHAHRTPRPIEYTGMLHVSTHGTAPG